MIHELELARTEEPESSIVRGPRADRDVLVVSHQDVMNPLLSLGARGLLVTLLARDGATVTDLVHEGISRAEADSAQRELFLSGYLGAEESL